MADLFWSSVEARPVSGTLFLPSSSVSVPWGLLKFCRPRNRVCISSNRKSVGCLVSKTKSPPTDAASSLPSVPESSSSSPPPPPTGLSDIDIISTSEHSDGSIVFRFGDVADAAEMEKISVQLDGAEVTSVSASEVASESLSSEDGKTVAVLGVLQGDQQELELSGDSVREVALEGLSKDTKGVVVLEEAESNAVQRISSNRKSIGCLVSKMKSPPTDAASSLPSVPESSSSSSSPPPTGMSDIDIISTSEHSDGSIVFRFGDAAEMEKISVQLDGAEVTSVSASEVASESLSSEDGKTVAVLGVLQGEQQELELSGDSVREVASESLSSEDGKTVAVLGVLQGDQQELELSGDSVREVALEGLSKDTKGVVVLEEAESNAVQLEEKAGTHSVVELPVAPLERVGDDGIGRGPSDHHVLSESHKLLESSGQTQLGLQTSYSFGSEVSLDKVSANDNSPVAEPQLDDSANLEDSGPVGTEFDTSATPFQNTSAASLVEEDSDLEESEQDEAPEEDDSPAPSDLDEAISLEEESLGQTSDGDNEDVNSIELPQENTIDDDDVKAVKEEEESPIRTEEEDTTTAFSGTVRASGEEHTEENIEVELPDLPTISRADEPKADTSTVDLTSEDTEEAASSPSSALVEAVSSEEAVGESSTPEEVVHSGEKSDITEMLDINTDESESDKSTSRREEIVLSEFYLSSGAASLPHPSKALAGGEDAYFVGDKNWLGVADGAGRWSMEGTNTGLYAKELMEKCKATASSPVNHPRDVLVRSTAETNAIGSSTALVAHFEDQVLLVASIGDSGFIIIRNGIVVERSRRTVHEFNFPVQIESGDDPSEHAECYRIELDEEDVIVAATDGLFDNLYEQEIASIVFKSLQAGLSPQAVAEVLATRAQELGSCTSARSPFSDAAQAAGYVGFTGGKLDDVTVIVSLVQRSSSSQQVK